MRRCTQKLIMLSLMEYLAILTTEKLLSEVIILSLKMKNALYLKIRKNSLKIYLMNPDFKLFEANTGVQALEVMEREDIHLILLDRGPAGT